MTRSDVIGGASVHLLDLAQGAQRAGHDIEILVGGDGVFLEHAQKKEIPCKSLKNMTREINPIKDFLGFFELKREISRINPDIVHLHSSKAGILGRLAAKSLSIPTVFTAHGWAFTEGVSRKRRFLYRFLEKIMARYTDKIITVSKYDKELALSLGVGDNSKLATIHNGIPESIERTATLTPNATVRMIMVARFEAPKNQLALINILSGMKHLDWYLELVGDGPLLDNAIKSAHQHSLSDRIFFAGACNDVQARLANADIFLLISDWEGLPLTILEAMRSGLPVIASKVGGVPEAVEEGVTGFMAERGNEHALATAISKLIESAELRKKMGAEARKKFERSFTFEEMLKKTIAIYEDTAQGKQ